MVLAPESETLSQPDPVRVGPARAAGRRTARRLLNVVGSVLVIVCVLVVFASLVGRAHVLPAPETRAGVQAPSSSLLVTEPIPRLGLHVGDVVVAAPTGSHEVGAYRITAIDSWTHDAYARGPRGPIPLRIGEHAQRVAAIAPALGLPLRLVLDFGRPWLLIIVGLLVARGAFLTLRRRRDHRRWSPTVPRQALRRTYTSRSWWTRFGAVLFGALGILSLSASATFRVVSSATASAHTITVASMKLTAGASGAQTNQLTVGASALAPGDRIQRSLDLTVSAGTTTGVMTGITLQASASPTSLLDSNSTNGLRIFVQECRTSGGATGWSQSPVDPGAAPWTYSCTKGAGGTWSDSLNSSPTNDPTAVPSANTCATSSGGTSSYRALSELASTYTLTNLPLSSGALAPGTVLHFVITMCFPTATGNTYQGLTSTLTFTFRGVQRSGMQK